LVKSSLRGSGAARAEARKGRRRDRKCRVDGGMMGSERSKRSKRSERSEGVNGVNGVKGVEGAVRERREGAS